jgi:hypothetical protein
LIVAPRPIRPDEIAIKLLPAFDNLNASKLGSKLWNPEAQVEQHSFPTLGRIIAEQTAAACQWT